LDRIFQAASLAGMPWFQVEMTTGLFGAALPKVPAKAFPTGYRPLRRVVPQADSLMKFRLLFMVNFKF
jgi:hypothetical protein